MYNNSIRTVVFPLLLAAGVVAGAALGLYAGRHSGVPQAFLPQERADSKLLQTLSLIESRSKASSTASAWFSTWRPTRLSC